MDLEFIDISQPGRERRTSENRGRNYVSGSAVRAERPVSENQYRQKRSASPTKNKLPCRILAEKKEIYINISLIFF